MAALPQAWRKRGHSWQRFDPHFREFELFPPRLAAHSLGRMPLGTRPLVRLFVRLFYLASLVFSLSAGGGQPATAVAVVKGGHVTSIKLLSGGSGYTFPPFIYFRSDTGAGAIANAVLNGDRVSSIVVTSPGFGYATAPDLVIGLPAGSPDPAPELVPKFWVSRTPDTWVEIQWTTSLIGNSGWQTWTNIVTDRVGSANFDLPAGAQQRHFRIVDGSLPEVLPGFVWIGPNTFQMGSPATEIGHKPDEIQHTVTLTHGFWICDHVVTQAEYFDLMQVNPSHTLGTNLPVDSVSWTDAQTYCTRLNAREAASKQRMTGYAYRLPTEAEWESAARAATHTRFYWPEGTEGSQASNYAWCLLNANMKSHAIKSKPPNMWYLYDMAGNVFQWCSDLYGPYDLSPQIDPAGPAGPSTSPHVTRGGSWNTQPNACRCACRASNTPGPETGFRLVLSAVK